MNKLILAVAVCAFFTTACAPKYDPAEVCSARWIKPRVDSAMAEFRGKSDDALAILRRTGEAIEPGSKPDPIQQVRVMFNLSLLANEFLGSQALKDIDTLSRTCKDPDLAINAFTDLLREYQVPDSFIQLLNEVDAFRKMAEEFAARNP